MNLSNFLKLVDKSCKDKSKKELEQFVHEWARNLSVGERTDFLSILEREGNVKAPLADEVHRIYEERFRDIKEKLTRIEDMELTLDCEMQEVYGEYYSYDNDYEYVYYDNSGIGRIIEEACELLYECVEDGEFSVGCELAEKLIHLSVFVDGDEWGELDEGLCLKDLPENGLAEIDYKKVILSFLYMVYNTSSSNNRPEALYKIMASNTTCEITFEEVMQVGDELQEVEAFLGIWIDFLGDKTSSLSQRLLEEALELVGDGDILLEKAQIFVNTHPGLYKKYLERQLSYALKSKEQSEKLYCIGQKALDTISKKYVMRSKIALLMLELARNTDDKSKADYCMFEAFVSETTISNYLRIVFGCSDYEKFKKEVDGICGKLLVKGSVKSSECYLSRNIYGRKAEELVENVVDNTTAYMLAFLQGDFENVLKYGMGVKQALGWSGTFMKCGLAVFLLLLYDAEILSVGGKRMCQMVSNHMGKISEDVLMSAGNDNEAETTWKWFLQWKNLIQISLEEKTKYLNKMEKLIEKRVQGIMDANRRNYYDECAAYVAALGEVKEAMGLVGSKQVVMEQYRAKYARRSAFHQALRDYGMLKTRK